MSASEGAPVSSAPAPSTTTPAPTPQPTPTSTALDKGRSPPATTMTSVGRGASRPCVVLSQNLVSLYKQVNEQFFKRKRLEQPPPIFNNGFDDKDGHYIVMSGEEILSRYTVQDVLGKGSFGTVLKCLDSKRQEQVALKVTRNGNNFRHQAKMEIDIILKLNGIPALHDYVVRLYKVFDWQGHLVLAFELLSYNLYQLISCTKFNGVSLDLTRKFAFQMLTVLHQLEMHNPPIIHCDLKPENVLLKASNRSGVRVIDFGSACYSTRKVFRYIQSRFYRSPEVILNLDYGTGIDRWSLGCMLVELHTGQALFDGRSEAAQLARFEGLLGPLPATMINASPKKNSFYVENTTTLKTPPIDKYIRTLSSIVGVNSGGPGGRRSGQAGHEPHVYTMFIELVQGLLAYDPAERISCAAALAHPFMQCGPAIPGTSLPAPPPPQQQQPTTQSQTGASTSTQQQPGAAENQQATATAPTNGPPQ